MWSCEVYFSTVQYRYGKTRYSTVVVLYNITTVYGTVGMYSTIRIRIIEIRRNDTQ